ncbi:MAG TPA: hydrogenase expression/formation C-terminal domain-containing protein, partial [Ideonella sp.]|nr:hydrogenase expression/formation C-terminal domain-containing protein [Ideonella sp.]
MKDFPIPVTMIGPGSQVEDETLSYMAMPQGMETFRSPVLPEPEAVAVCEAAHRVLRATLAALAQTVGDGVNRCIDLAQLPPADLALVNQVLGEGEVSALVKAAGDPTAELRVQESVYAGVWRVIRSAQGRL